MIILWPLKSENGKQHSEIQQFHLVRWLQSIGNQFWRVPRDWSLNQQCHRNPGGYPKLCFYLKEIQIIKLESITVQRERDTGIKSALRSIIFLDVRDAVSGRRLFLARLVYKFLWHFYYARCQNQFEQINTMYIKLIQAELFKVVDAAVSNRVLCLFTLYNTPILTYLLHTIRGE